ncbi:MAG: toxin [Candidatus Omnitrophica bacterium]|nr:toxin [Candidatus Omnitrophota bacterium]
MSPYFRWNSEKNEQLKRTRVVCFEQIVMAVEKGGILSITKHPNTGRYPNQEIMSVVMDEYVFIVPFVREEDGTFFLKTIIPSRKATRGHTGGNDHETI